LAPSAQDIKQDHVDYKDKEDAKRIPGQAITLLRGSVDKPGYSQACHGDRRHHCDEMLLLDSGEQLRLDIEQVVDGQDGHIEEVTAKEIADGRVDRSQPMVTVNSGNDVDIATKMVPTNVVPKPVISAMPSAIRGKKMAAPTTTAALTA
jgi:hypothetical protein